MLPLMLPSNSNFDIGKTHHSGVADLLAGKLRSKRKTSDTESSGIVG